MLISAVFEHPDDFPIVRRRQHLRVARLALRSEPFRPMETGSRGRSRAQIESRRSSDPLVGLGPPFLVALGGFSGRPRLRLDPLGDFHAGHC
jgi:hypothetical protein